MRVACLQSAIKLRDTPLRRPIRGLKGSITDLRGPITGLQRGPITGPRGPIASQRAHSRIMAHLARGPFENKVDKRTISFHFWEGPFSPGGPSMAYVTHVAKTLAVPLTTSFFVRGCPLTLLHFVNTRRGPAADSFLHSPFPRGIPGIPDAESRKERTFRGFHGIRGFPAQRTRP